MSIPFGRYELLKKLAAGGMGQVFLARKKGVGFEKLVVLKTILPHLVEDEEFFQMFIDEAKLTARLNHPNIAQIFDVEEEGHQRFVVMEYVQGEDVRRIEKRARAEGIRLPLGVVLRIIADAAAGLDYAHKAREDNGTPMGIVHRDISPQNILVGFDGGVKVIDFGVAKAAGRLQHTATGVLKGKFPYMSPEQAEGEELDARSDIFALGIVLWELLCDRRLFKGENDTMSQRLVKSALVPPPSTLEAGLPKELDQIVLKALAKKREDRYPDCAALRLALEDFSMDTRQQASSAHLTNFMQKLYADRISELSDSAVLDELQPGADLSGMVRAGMATPNPTGSRSRGLGAARLDPEQGVVTVQSRQTDVVGGKRTGKAAWLIAGTLALVGIAAAAFFVGQRRPPEPVPVAQVPVPTVPPVPVPTVAPSKPVTALAVTVSSEPAGADVELAGKHVGTTPLELSVERASLPALVRLTRDGFEPQSSTLTEDSGPALSLQLEKKKKTTATGTKPLGIKTGR